MPRREAPSESFAELACGIMTDVHHVHLEISEPSVDESHNPQPREGIGGPRRLVDDVFAQTTSAGTRTRAGSTADVAHLPNSAGESIRACLVAAGTWSRGCLLSPSPPTRRPSPPAPTTRRWPRCPLAPLPGSVALRAATSPSPPCAWVVRPPRWLPRRLAPARDPRVSFRGRPSDDRAPLTPSIRFARPDKFIHRLTLLASMFRALPSAAKR